MNTHEDRAREFLLHMAEAANKILLYTERVDRDSFWENEMLQDAVIRNIAIIGEAAKQLQDTAPKFAMGHPELPFAHIYGMRNRVIHGYATVNLSLVWDSVQIDVPQLRAVLTKILAEIDAHSAN